MLLSAIAAAALPKTMTILFIGNSHTTYNDLAGMVRNLLINGRQVEKVTTKVMAGTNLNEIAKNPAVSEEIKSGKWNTVVIQAALVSSSHKYKYKQDGGIALAKLAKQSKANTFLFAEWPRKGIDESMFVMQVYGEIGRLTNVPVIPVPYVFKQAIQADPKLDLWHQDGNHASPLGSYLAAATIYYWLSDQVKPIRIPDWYPKWLDASTGKRMVGFARDRWTANNS